MKKNMKKLERLIDDYMVTHDVNEVAMLEFFWSSIFSIYLVNGHSAEDFGSVLRQIAVEYEIKSNYLRKS